MSERRPYFAADPAWWACVSELLPLPFTLDAVLLDLRYLENECRRGERFPSRRQLERRWGWGRRRVERALAGELGAWHDQRRPLTIDQLRGNVRPVPAMYPALTQRDEGEPPQPGGDVPSADPVMYPGKAVQDSIGDGVQPAAGADPRGDSCAHASASTRSTRQPEEVLSEPLLSTRRADLVVLDDDKARRKRQASEALRQAVLAVYAAWKARHPQAPESPTEDNAGKIRDRLRPLATQLRQASRPPPDPLAAAVEQAVLVSEWIHQAPDAAHWQGFNRRGPGGAGRKYLGIASIYKRDKWGDRLQSALDWRDAGQPVNDDLGVQEYQGEVAPAWAYLLRLLRDRELPAQLHPDPPKDAAFRAAIKAVGLDDLRRSTERDRVAMRRVFADAYTAARRDGQTQHQHRSTGA